MQVLVLLLLVLFVLCFPLVLSLLGLVLPPPRNKPVGVLYWLTLAWTLFQLLLIEVVYWAVCWDRRGFLPDHAHIAPFLPVPVAILLLLANTLWGLGQAKRIPESLDEEAQRESLRRLSGRLWFVLCVVQGALTVFIVHGFSSIGAT